MQRDVMLRFWGSVISLILAAVVPFAACSFDLKPAIDTQAEWFQRSGSIMVLIAVAVEYELFKISSVVDPSGFASVKTNELRDTYFPRLGSLKIIGAMIAITGTVIWGYGDILYNITNG